MTPLRPSGAFLPNPCLPALRSPQPPPPHTHTHTPLNPSLPFPPSPQIPLYRTFAL